MQIVNNFALEPSSKLYSFHNLFVNRNVYAMLLLFIPYKFLVRMMIKFRITKEKEKEEDTIKRLQQNVQDDFRTTFEQ